MIEAIQMVDLIEMIKSFWLDHYTIGWVMVYPGHYKWTIEKCLAESHFQD